MDIHFLGEGAGVGDGGGGVMLKDKIILRLKFFNLN